MLLPDCSAKQLPLEHICSICDIPQYGFIDGLASDDNGNFFFTNNRNGTITKIDINTKKETNVLRGGSYYHGIISHTKSNTLFICSDYIWANSIIAFSIESGDIAAIAPEYGEYDSSANAWDLVLDQENNCYFTKGDRIMKSNVTKKVLEVYAGSESGYCDGELKNAKFRCPNGITMSKDGTIYVADTGNNCIRKIKDGIVSTVTGTGIKLQNEQFSNSCFHVPRIVKCIHSKLFVLGANDALRVMDLDSERVLSHQLSADCITEYNGDIYIVSRQQLLRIDTGWKWERLLWIAKMKEKPANCHLAKLPNEIIREIAGWIKAQQKATYDEAEERSSKRQKTGWEMALACT